MGAAGDRGVPSGLGATERRILNPRPYRVFRKTYSVGEARAGAVILGFLLFLSAWVAWRGATYEPLPPGDVAAAAPAGRVPSVEAERRRSPDEARRDPAGSSDTTARPGQSSGRGGLPAGLAGPGWSERDASRFDAENLYEKIDGRADFFLSRGFRSLTCVSLQGPSAVTVDVELYDLGSPQNALGAFAAEKPGESRASTGGGTSWYVARNALFLARGSTYVRAIGSDDSAAVLGQLEHLRTAIERGVEPGERPWSAALFGDALGISADRVQYAAENAFSFGFARNVSFVSLDDGETELFVLPAGDAAEAETLASRFEAGFLSYGDRAEVAGATWVRDRYLGAFSRAEAVGSMVVGVRGAPEPSKAAASLARLEKGVLALPPEVAKAAAAGASASPKRGAIPHG